MVERYQVQLILLRQRDLLVEHQGHGTAAAPRGAALARVIDENPAHQARGDGKKVNSVLPVHRVPPDQPEISLMYKRRALQSVIVMLRGKALLGDAP
jgi:hypothetical protein